MIAVAQNGYALEFVSEQLQNDREVVMTSLPNKGLALKFASKELQSDPEVVMQAQSRGEGG